MEECEENVKKGKKQGEGEVEKRERNFWEKQEKNKIAGYRRGDRGDEERIIEKWKEDLEKMMTKMREGLKEKFNKIREEM